MPIADLSTLINATAQNLSQFKGLSFAYNLVGGAPSIAGYTSLIKANNNSNFGAGAGTTFNDENVYINTLNALYQGNAAAKTAFDGIVSGGATLSDKLELVYNNLIPAGARTDAGLAYFKSQAAFYEARAIELGVAGANGAALVAYAGLAKIAVDNDIGGLGDTVNDLIAAVKNGTAVLPEDGTAFTPLEDADGTQFDNDDVVVTPVGDTFTLTTGADTGAAFTAGSGNDIFNAAQTTGPTWTVGDAIDGGTGNDTFNVTQTAAVTNPVGTKVSNIETMNVLSGTTGNNLDTTTFTGLTALNVTGVTAQTVKAAATTDVAVTGSTATGATAVNGGKAVSVTETGASGGTVNIGATTAAAGAVTVNSTILATGGSTGNGITVKGGTEISVTQKGVNAVNTTVTDGAVAITGDANTKTVTVTNDKAATAALTVVGHVNGAVGVTDVNAASTTAAGVIETVSLNSFAAATVNSGALKTLNLSGTGTSVNALTLGALTTVANTALALNTNGLTTTGAVSIDTDITTLNVGSSTATSTVANLVAAGAKSVNVSGDAILAVTTNTLTALTDVTVTNTAGFQLNGTAINVGATFTGGAGKDAVTLGATTKAITMGAGDDTVTTTGLVGVSGSVDAGEGIDTVVMTSAQAAVADNDATFNSKFKGFEVLRVSDQLAVATTLNLTGINGVSTVELAAGGAAANSIIDNLASKGTVKLLADSTAFAVQVKDAAFNAADELNLNLSKAGILAAGAITAAGVETINIASSDAVAAGSAAVINTVTLTAADATTITVAGNNGLDLSASVAAKVTNFDASGVVGNGTADTAANLAVKYTSDNATAAATVTITGGAGNDVLIGNAAKDTIVGGAGDDSITGGTGIDILTGGTGRDTFIIADNDAGITGAEKVTDFTIGLTGDTLDIVATVLIADQTATNVTAVIGGAVDVTATVKNGIITVGGADAALVDTLGEWKAIFEAIDAGGAVADTAAFVFGGNTYVATGVDAVTDIIQLTGVTNATALVTVAADGGILIA